MARIDVTFKVTGIREAAAKFRRLQKVMEGKVIPDAVEKTADMVADKFRTVLSGPSVSSPGDAPGKDTGLLQASITNEGKGALRTVGPTAHYAGYLEDGTRKMAARPFTGRAVEGAEGFLMKTLLARIQSEL